MFYRKRQTLGGIVVLLTMLLYGNALAEEHGDSISVALHSAETSIDSHSDLDADSSSDNSEVIEEIVVTGGKKNRGPKRDRNPRDDLAISTPSLLQWELFPAYDPDRALQQLGLHPIDHQLQRVGIVEVFRISFGR